MLRLTAARTIPRKPISSTFIARRAASTSSQQTQQAGSFARTAAYASLFVVSTGLFAVYYSDCRAALHKYIVTPVIRYTLDPETGHRLAVKVLGSGLAPRDPLPDDDVLKVEVRAYVEHIGLDRHTEGC